MKRLVVISAPSGVGKSTLIGAVMPHYPQMVFSVSATTRPKRPYEVNEKDYFFLDEKTFQNHIDQGDFIEHTRVYDNLYGTLLHPIQKTVEAGSWPVLDVDSEGLKRIRPKLCRSIPDLDIISILILPVSMDILCERLRTRGTETEEIIKRRMRYIYNDIKESGLYTYVLINDKLNECVHNLHTLFDQHPHLSVHTHPQLFMHTHAHTLLSHKNISPS